VKRALIGLWVLLTLLGAFATAAVVRAGPASAHATVVGSSPADGARLAAAPRIVSITFDEPVGLGGIGYLHVVTGSGRRVDTGGAFHPGGDGRRIATNLLPGLGNGAYLASFRVISADTHPVAGAVQFVVGHGAFAIVPAARSTVDHLTSALFDVLRWLSFAGLAGLGGLWLIVTVWPAGRSDGRARRIVWAGWLLAAVGTVGGLLLQGPYTADDGPAAIARSSLLRATLRSDYGHVLAARLVLLAVVALVLWPVLRAGRRSPSRATASLDWSIWPLGGLIAYTYAAVGHAETTQPRWLSIPIDMVHVLAMAGWVGGLALLLGAVLPRRRPDELRLVLPAFSRVAFGCAVLIAASGAYLAWHGIGTVDAITTSYGLLVIAKIVLFGFLVAVGNLSRVAIARQISATSDQPELVRRGVVVETALAAAVLAVTAVLVAEPRGPEALAIAAQRPVTAGAPLGGGRAVYLTIDPRRHGSVVATVAVSGGPPTRSVSGTAALPGRQLGPIPLRLARIGPRLYGANGVLLPVSGDWQFTIVVSTSKFDATTTAVTIHLS
jgi:copper transport protein